MPEANGHGQRVRRSAADPRGSAARVHARSCAGPGTAASTAPRPIRPGARLLLLAALAAAYTPAAPARAEVPAPPPRPSHTLFGMTGLIDTPTAGMQPDAQVTLSTAWFGGFGRNTVSFQILPFLEGAFRYSVLDDFFAKDSVRRALYDRSFDVKLRLVEEGPAWPAVAVGLQDFLGTGVYSGEYLVATKGFLGGDLTVTAGIGWGRYATLNGFNNPVGWVSERARSRDEPRSGGGRVNFGQYFQGEEAGLFGGLAWRTPLDGLTLKAEYSNDNYFREDDFSAFRQSIPLNFGLEYRPRDWIEIGGYWMYGREAGLRVTLSGNVNDPAFGAETAPAPPPVLPRPVTEADRARAEAALGAVFDAIGEAPATRFFDEVPIASVAVEERIAGVRWARATLLPAAAEACPLEAATALDAGLGVLDAVTFETAGGRALCTLALRPEGERAIALTREAALRPPTGWAADPEAEARVASALGAALAPEGIRLVALALAPGSATVHVENLRWNQMPRAIGRTARVLTQVLPPSVAEIAIVPVEAGLPVVSIALSRALLEAQADRPDAAHATWSAVRVADAPPLAGAARAQAAADHPRLGWALQPLVPISLFDPDEPVRADLQIALAGSAVLAPGLSASGTVTKRVVGNLDGIVRESDSTLPRVRSDIARYLDAGDPAITRLTGDYVTKLAPAVYGRLSGGYLERMFGGVQGELLWKPAGQSWGLGAEVAWVQQRDFDTLFGFRDYDVVTGHVSLYWDTGWQDLALEVDAGRYLAGDWGGTLSLRRRFANGWEIGGFATVTDAGFDAFGEGSFDKGLFLTVPLNWTLPWESRSRIATVIRPLSRDGGQRLEIANRLYPVVQDMDARGLARRSGSFWE